MRVFLTGATGFIGTAIIPELLQAGHRVLGLTRSDAGAQALTRLAAEPHHGDLEDLASLRAGAEKADAVIHCGFVHDFSRFVEVCAIDRRAIEAMGDVLLGSARPLIITSGTGMGNSAPGQTANEDYINAQHTHPRVATELAGAAVAERGVDVRVVRLPQVHDTVKQGLVTQAVAMARQKGVSAYVGDGLNRWPAGARLDVAHLYRLVLEKGAAGQRYNAVGEEGVTMREIAEALGRGLNVPVKSLTPEQAADHFGWLAMFAGYDMPASSALTQQRLGWKPVGPGLIADLDGMDYSKA